MRVLRTLRVRMDLLGGQMMERVKVPPARGACGVLSSPTASFFPNVPKKKLKIKICNSR